MYYVYLFADSAKMSKYSFPEHIFIMQIYYEYKKSPVTTWRTIAKEFKVNPGFHRETITRLLRNSSTWAEYAATCATLSIEIKLFPQLTLWREQEKCLHEIYWNRSDKQRKRLASIEKVCGKLSSSNWHFFSSYLSSSTTDFGDDCTTIGVCQWFSEPQWRRPHRTSDMFAVLAERFQNHVIALGYRDHTEMGITGPFIDLI